MRNEHVNDVQRQLLNGLVHTPGAFEPEPIELVCWKCGHIETFADEADRRVAERESDWCHDEDGDWFCSKGCRNQSHEQGEYADQ